MSEPVDGISGVIIERPSMSGRFSVLKALKALLEGLRITGSYLVRPGTVVTRQYPENRAELEMFERFRSRLSMVHDEDGYHKCTVCRLCEQSCPNASIKISARETPATGKPEVDTFIWRLDSCTFCNACVMVCPHSVLTMDGKFESAAYDRRLLVYNLSQYAGPPSGVLKKVEDPQERQKMTQPRTPYSGPLPLSGHDWPGVEGLRSSRGKSTKSEDEE